MKISGGVWAEQVAVELPPFSGGGEQDQIFEGRTMFHKHKQMEL